MRKYLLFSFPILLVWGLLSGLFLPWFEYSTHWHPPKWLQFEQTYERLRFYEFGPDWYPPLENSNSTGCYMAVSSGLSAPSESLRRSAPSLAPLRLHISTLTNFQVSQIRFMRFMALFLGGISLSLNLIFSVVSLRHVKSYLAGLRLRGYQYGALIIGLGLLSGLCLLAILLALGPIVGTPTVNSVRDPLPGWQHCPALPASPDATYDLAEWELHRILYLAPGLMILNVVLTLGAIIAWRRS